MDPHPKTALGPDGDTQSAKARPVLLAEDNPTNRKVLESYLTKLDLPFKTVVNGEEAVDAYRASTDGFRCILMDISMPVLDGLHATRQIRQHEQEHHANTVLIIGMSVQEDTLALSAGDFDSFLRKPPRLEPLRAVLTEQNIL